MWDEYGSAYKPQNSDHINGVIFESSNLGRTQDMGFGDRARECQFLAKYHHNEHNLKILSEIYPKGSDDSDENEVKPLLSYQELVDFTKGSDMN